MLRPITSAFFLLASCGMALAESSTAHAPAPAAEPVHTAAPAAQPGGLCQGFGPQTPRDISNWWGENQRRWTMAPKSSELNLCNIHLHVQAEHKGPGFSMFAGSGTHGGYRCNETSQLSSRELVDPTGGHGSFKGVTPGDTIEVHWVYSSCDVRPGPGLGSCLSDSCANPELRVESQVFLVVNDGNARQFQNYIYGGHMVGGLHQPRSLPSGTGDPVVFAGSTTGPSYTEQTCSPLQVTWSVRPKCAKIDITSLNLWAAGGNPFKEDHAHGVRELVTAPSLLSQIRH